LLTIFYDGIPRPDSCFMTSYCHQSAGVTVL
jgi:hypothetical protein